MTDPTDGCPGCGTMSRVHDVGCDYVGTDECPWCLDEHDDEYSEKLCRTHLAEYEGLSVSELDRIEDEQGAELYELEDERDGAWYGVTYH